MKIDSKTISLLTHDLKGPVGNVAMFSQLVSSSLDTLQQELGDEHDISILKWQVDYIHTIAQKYVDQLQNWADFVFMSEQKHNFENELVSLNQIIKESVSENELFWKKKNLKFEVKQDFKANVSVESDLLRRIIDNLMQIMILLASNQSEITISLVSENNEEDVKTIFKGLPVQDAELFNNLFINEQVYQSDAVFTKGIIKTTGIGLAFCGTAIRAIGGKPFAELNESTFEYGFSLPVVKI